MLVLMCLLFYFFNISYLEIWMIEHSFTVLTLVFKQQFFLLLSWCNSIKSFRDWWPVQEGSSQQLSALSVEEGSYQSETYILFYQSKIYIFFFGWKNLYKNSTQYDSFLTIRSFSVLLIYSKLIANTLAMHDNLILTL